MVILYKPQEKLFNSVSSSNGLPGMVVYNLQFHSWLLFHCQEWQVQIEKKGKKNKSREEIFYQMKGFFV